MNFGRKQLIVTAILLGTVLFATLGYSVVDQAITIDHLRQEVRRLRDTRSMLQQLANDSLQSMNGADPRSVLKSKYGSSHLLTDEGSDVLYVDGVGIRFKGPAIAEISDTGPLEDLPAAAV